MNDDFSVLREFLEMPHGGNAVLKRFASLPGATRFPGEQNDSFVYVPGSSGMPLLCAHADVYSPYNKPLEEDNEKFFRNDDLLGGDDRAGCALLWEVRKSGCGMLIFDGEERGCCGSIRLCNCLSQPSPTIIFPEKLSTQYTFIITPDLARTNRWKTYGCASASFQTKVAQLLGTEPETSPGWTDAAVLGEFLNMNVCNLAVGYYHPHTSREFLKKQDYLWARQKITELLSLKFSKRRTVRVRSHR